MSDDDKKKDDGEKKKPKRLSKREKKKLAKDPSFFFHITEREDTGSEYSSDNDDQKRDDAESSEKDQGKEMTFTRIPKIVRQDEYEKEVDIEAEEGMTEIKFIDDDDDDDDFDFDEDQDRLMALGASTLRRASKPIVLPRKASTPRSSIINLPQAIKAEKEPTSYEQMKPEIRQRTTVALQKTVAKLAQMDMIGYMSIEEKEETRTEKVISNVSDPESSIIKYPPAMEPPPMSEELKQGNRLGTKISQDFLLPGMPQLLADLWIFIELSVTLFQLIFSLVNMNISSNKVFNGLYIALASVNVLLACTDAFLYFYELKSCKAFYNWFKSVRGELKDDRFIEEGEGEGIEEQEEQEKKRCCPCEIKVPEKVLSTFNQWFEIMRTILGELLVYPLVVLDLFDLLAGGAFRLADTNSRISFSMFIVGSFYMVLSVYIGRIIMSVTTIGSIQGLSSTTKNDSDYMRVFVRFLFHVLAQVAVHLLCVVAVGVKIWEENMTLTGSEFRASPLLWGVIAGGWIIPFLGIVSYFIVNYYWIRSFSIGMFVDMIGLLQEPDFAESVFCVGEEEGMKEVAAEKSEKLLSDVKYFDIKQEAKTREELTSPMAKIMYPLKVPFFLLYAVFYDVILSGFITCLVLEYNYQTHKYGIVELTTNTGMAIVVTIILVIISNLHIVLLINIWMIIILFGLLVGLLSFPVLIVVGAVYFLKRKVQKNNESNEEELPMLAS